MIRLLTVALASASLVLASCATKKADSCCSAGSDKKGATACCSKETKDKAACCDASASKKAKAHKH